ncbi:hypothetical protein MVEN_02169800 [Mycena venus]|uniref:Uncharacterized protein n=1 Tax=Mycena venus TaxID=2733690 RepID=A0A8H7CG83_9AGAR|nr:hypothetical protein MVEN_02169800 [Mycena venus]
MDASDTRSDIATYILGGWDLAICAALFFQGVLCAQFMRYLNVCKRDSVLLKLFVAGLALITTLKTIQALAMLWIQNVSAFENLDAASNLWQQHWLFHTTLMASAVIAFYVQIFFCYRLWAISRNVYLVFATFSLFILALACAGVATWLTFTDMAKSVEWIAAHLGGGDVRRFPSDWRNRVLFACTPSQDLSFPVDSTAFQRHSKIVLPCGQTAHMLNALLRLTLQAPPAAVCALVNFISAMQLNRTGDWVRTELMLSEIANMMLPKLYAISAMWTLNSRGDIRRAVENGPVMQTLNFSATVRSSPQRDTDGRSETEGRSETLGSFVEDVKLRLDSP